MLEPIRRLFELIYAVLPKHHHAVIYDWPDGADHSLAIEQGLQGTGVNQVVLLMGDPNASLPVTTGPKTILCRKNSLRGMFFFLTARYVFFTHRCFALRFPPNVVSVNLWHGMPIKRIGRLLDGANCIRATLTTATSPFWQEIMRQSMDPRGGFTDLGLPRNDRLFHDRADVRSRLGIDGPQRLIVWLPTYRNSARGAIRADGHDHGNPFELPDADPDQINQWLARQGARMILKSHPMSPHGVSSGWSHLQIVDAEWLHDRGISLYSLLAASDALISDVSSVVIDYLLLDRPIIHAFADIEEYQNSRGFSVDPIDDFFCGPVVRTQHELLDCLASVLQGADPEAQRRRKMLDLSHTHRDGKATERLLQAIDL